MNARINAQPRHDWTREEVRSLFALPFNDLVYSAQNVHRTWFDPNRVERNMLLSIKTGACTENCGYCAQSAHHSTGLTSSTLMDPVAVVEQARISKTAGAERFCMGAAWRGPKDKDMDVICEMIRGVKNLGLETCMTLGMLSDSQVEQLVRAGLDYYNHNLDSSPEYYSQVVTTRSFDDRLKTLARVRNAGIRVCCGGIIGMGETREDRVGLLVELANMPEHPQSVPINALVPIEGTPLGTSTPVGTIELARTIAAARITMPKSVVRLAAGREHLSDEAQALCFLAGASSVFIGDKLLVADNCELEADERLFSELGLH